MNSERLKQLWEDLNVFRREDFHFLWENEIESLRHVMGAIADLHFKKANGEEEMQE